MYRESGLALTIFVANNMGFCSQPEPEPTPSGFSCEDYQLMIDVELNVLQSCSDASECTQQLDGFYEECESTVLLLNSSANPVFLYDMYEEAVGYGCDIQIGEENECFESPFPTCSSGKCRWTDTLSE